METIPQTRRYRRNLENQTLPILTTSTRTRKLPSPITHPEIHAFGLEKILKKIPLPLPEGSPPLKQNQKHDQAYVEENLIAYIGNKRRLLDLIKSAVEEVETSGSQPVNREGLFVDYFAGTGVVSRLMKSFGFNVIANDWEYYSYCLNRGFLESSEKDLSLFDDEGGIERVLEELNSLTEEVPGDAYISRYYCPEDDQSPDPEHERLFYTRQNGILIDNIRAAISRRYGNSLIEEKKKDILLALLLVQSSKRSNTSGVFKGFHYGFGGKKKDALSRILSPVALERPRLSTHSNHSIATCLNALDLARILKPKPAEIVYLDPPYNQHQYGSNYHLLNTIARHDRPTVNKEFWIKGKKVGKSAIRKDWVRTKSGFCYLKTACHDFAQLIDDINSKYILVSYSSEGLIPLEDMITILATKGKVGIITRSYVRYRGGRQANHTQNRNLEFILMVDTSVPSSEKDIENVKAVFLSGSLQNLFSNFIPVHNLEKLGLSFSLSPHPVRDGYSLTLPDFPQNRNLTLEIDKHLFVNSQDIAQIRKFNFTEQQQVIHLFSTILIRPNHIKAMEIHDLILEKDYTQLDRLFLFREFERYFRKVNFYKNPEIEPALKEMRETLKKSFSSTSVP